MTALSFFASKSVCNFTTVLHEPDPDRHGNAPAYIHAVGSRHAPLWTTQCLDCDATLGWHRLLSAALAELTWHQEMHRVWRTELAHETRACRTLTAVAGGATMKGALETAPPRVARLTLPGVTSEACIGGPA